MRSALLWAFSCALAGCGQPAVDDLVVVEDGKEDNYFSPSAREYFAEGTGHLRLEDKYLDKSAEEKLQRARVLMGLKTIAIGWFLSVRLIDKEIVDAQHTDPNARTYPGFHALTRQGAYDTANLTPLADGLTYSFHVRLQVAGQKELIARLPGASIDADHKRITLQMGKPSNADLARLDPEHEWFHDEEWDESNFDPTKMAPADLEPIDLTISPQRESEDAWFDVKKLFADGRLTIDVHYGYDYWDRFDISGAKNLYDALVADGFASPNRGFGGYDGSKPLTKVVTADGRAVVVEVRIFHAKGRGMPGPDPDTDEGGIVMEKNMVRSLGESDVVVFSGHSGDFYGFALANWKKTDRGALDYPALSAAKLAFDKYQIVFASGCDTFSIGQAFRDNASKPNLKDLRVITTNSFADAGEDNADLMALLDTLYAHTRAGRVSPQPVSRMLERMNGGRTIGAMYGLHGIDGDPRLHPFANLRALGKSCAASDECGDEGNRCVARGAKKVCAAACMTDAACPSSFRCRAVASASTREVDGSMCLPQN